MISYECEKRPYQECERLTAENQRLTEQNKNLCASVTGKDIEIQRLIAQLNRAEQAARNIQENSAESIKALREALSAEQDRSKGLEEAGRRLAAIARTVEEDCNDGCVYCGYKWHRSTCSLNGALEAWRTAVSPEQESGAPRLSDLPPAATHWKINGVVVEPEQKHADKWALRWKGIAKYYRTQLAATDTEPGPVNPYAHCEELLAERNRLLDESKRWKTIEEVFDIVYDKNRALRSKLATTDCDLKQAREENARLGRELSYAHHLQYEDTEERLKMQSQLAEAEEALKRGQFAIAQLEKELEYQKHLGRVARTSWSRAQEENGELRASHKYIQKENDNLRGRLGAAEEALQEVQKESAKLREQKEHIHHDNMTAFDQLRAVFPNPPSRIIGLVGLAIAARDEINSLRAERDRFQEDYVAMMQEHNAAMAALMEAKPPSTMVITGLAQYACQVKDYIADLQARHARLREDHTRIHQAAGKVMKENADLQNELTTWKAGADNMARQCERLKREAIEMNAELEAARKVADAATAAEIALRAQARLNNLHVRELVVPAEDQIAVFRLLDAQRAAKEALRKAVREYRERTNNQQPQGEQSMPTLTEVAQELDREARPNVENKTASGHSLEEFEKEVEEALTGQREEQSQAQLEAEMKKRLDQALKVEPAAVEVRLTDDWPRPGSATVAVTEAPEATTPRTFDDPVATSRAVWSEAKAKAKAKAEQRPAPTEQPSNCEGYGGPQPITPETAPAGARILIQRSVWNRELTEVTVLEWALSGRRVKMQWLSGAVTWESGLLEQGRLVERLPEDPLRKIVRVMAQKMAERLTGNGAEQPQSLDNIITFEAFGGNRVEALDNAIQRLEELKRAAQQS